MIGLVRKICSLNLMIINFLFEELIREAYNPTALIINCGSTLHLLDPFLCLIFNNKSTIHRSSYKRILLNSIKDLFLREEHEKDIN